MPSWLDGKPFAITFAVLFGIVLLRAQATYWIARGVTAGVLHTRWAAKVTGPRTTRAIAALNRWGLPLVTISFLTIGLQTVVNAAAGLIRMPWIRYTIAMLIGCVAWALIYATVGIAAVEAGTRPGRAFALGAGRGADGRHWCRHRVHRHPASSGTGRCTNRRHQPADGRPVALNRACRARPPGGRHHPVRPLDSCAVYLFRRIRLVAYGARLESVLG